MTFLELWLALLLAFSHGQHCDMGQAVDWYAYTAAHKFVDEEHMTVPLGQGTQQQVLWLMSDTGDQIVFWYNPAAMPHGVCARFLPDDLRVAP